LADFEQLLSLLQEAVAEVLSYHVVLGEALTLDQLTDGLILQTMVDGPEGQLKV
jgi:hypothetical protein